ncbi:MAG: non-homologous end-joining DNA ligase [Bryobacterales bacterium]|nr:non-homologous end-joining DNA ligase [Bryobacterales bacterium]
MPRRRTSSAENNNDAGTTVSIGKRHLKLTRLNKVLYPDGTTKAQIVDYYVRAAPVLLPHLAGRPVTLKRYPDGVKSEAFWEKDAPSFTPDWVRTSPVPRRAGGEPIHYIVIEEPATLAWTANIGAIELHPFLHRVTDLNQPTAVVFDLDPGEGATVLSSIEVAFLVRRLLERLSLAVYPKVSGSKGIQLYVPLNSPETYSVTQPFARTVARLLEEQRPDCVVSEMPKAQRTGRIFIDWSQNSDYKTTVGVYSLRAKRERPYVSMPVDWEELETALKKKTPDLLLFSPEAALARIAERGDLFEPVLTARQHLPDQVIESIEGERRRAGAAPKNLQKYEQKRDFSRTPEPAPLPRRSAQGGRRRFVIQKHAASHLHYDLRLEIHGALKSWAVPKGVPLEPGVRRLASATEDHPLEYLDFEGVIPQGQYGGGTVMVWDIGTYEIVEGNYWKGRLHVAFSGKKLNGEWMLTRDRHKGENAWTMEKMGAAQRIPESSQDRSALSDRTLEEIAAARERIWHSNRGDAAVIGQLPEAEQKFVAPMLAKLVDHLPTGREWLYETKLDGYRTLIVRADRSLILSRRNQDLTGDFPELITACGALEQGTTLDGEIVAIDEQGRPNFNLLQNRRRTPSAIRFYAFDLIHYRGRSLLNLPLEQRRGLLENALAGMDSQGPMRLSATLDAPPETLVAAARKLGLEGIVAKRRESVYEPGKRSGAWVKFKLNLDQELVIGGYLPAPKRHFDALLVGYYDSRNRLFFAGKVRNGFKEPGVKENLFKKFAGLGLRKCPFGNLPEPANARRGMALTREAMQLCCWLKPELVAQIGIREWTQDGHLRHATFVGLREDKDPITVHKEQSASSH